MEFLLPTTQRQHSIFERKRLKNLGDTYVRKKKTNLGLVNSKTYWTVAIDDQSNCANHISGITLEEFYPIKGCWTMSR